MKQIVHTRSGINIESHFLKEYNGYKLFFCQDRLVLTSPLNGEIDRMDILNWIIDTIDAQQKFDNES